MPAFLTAHFWDISNPEFWVGVGLVIFFAIVILAGVPKLVAAGLDAKAAKIQQDLDEAARLRAEAEAMLAQIRKEKAEAEATREVKSAAADLAAKAAHEILAARIAGAKTDPALDAAIGQLAGKLN